MSGCKHALAVQYCNGTDSGPQLGQLASITISQSLATYGESLNYGQIGQTLSATGQDCKGTAVSISHIVYSSSAGFVSGNANNVYADINPSNGQICAGTWNRNTGGGVSDYTVCTAPVNLPAAPNSTTPVVAYVTATADGATSNAIPVFVHSQPSSIQIGQDSTGNDCTTNPTSNCCAVAYTAPQPSQVYTGSGCISQGQTGQVVSRVLDSNGKNITCQVGHIVYAAVGATNAVSFDQNGVGTAGQPGSAVLTASIAGSGSSSTAGFWSTCAPKNITLQSNQSSGPITGLLNVATPFNAIVTDTMGNQVTGLALEYESSTPETIPAGSNNITPTFPGSTSITAVCAPPSCNASPYSQIDLFSNGTTLTSNSVQFSVAGHSSSVLYVASTQSQYFYWIDFTTGQNGSLVKLPYAPNSMVVSVDGSSIYLGSSTALMTVSTATNTVTGDNVALTGPVISLSPNGQTLVVTDPNREMVYLVSSSGSIVSQQGGVATSAAWSPDSSTVYITTAKSASYPAQLLVHNANTSWTAFTESAAFTDVAVTVPHIGAYFAGPSVTEGHSYCPLTISESTDTPPAVTNQFYPVVDTNIANTRIAATNDGVHMLGVTATPTATLNDLVLGTSSSPFPYQQICNPATNTTPVTPGFVSTNTPHVLSGITASAITDVKVASNSAAAFVTYTAGGASTGQLPLYLPASGTVSNVQLSGTATAPVAGVFSSDDAFFYVDTSGDNLVHIVQMTYPSSGNPTAVDSSTLTPALPSFNPTPTAPFATPNLIVQRVKKPTS